MLHWELGLAVSNKPSIRLRFKMALWSWIMQGCICSSIIAVYLMTCINNTGWNLEIKNKKEISLKSKSGDSKLQD